MLIIKHTLVANKVSPEDIWNIWQDVENYNAWDLVTEYSSLDGSFKEGAKGKWKAKEGPILEMKVTRVEPLKVFISEFKLFLARIVASHYLTESAGKTHVTQQLEIKGPLAFLFAYHLRNTMKKNLPIEMESLIKRIEFLNTKKAELN